MKEEDGDEMGFHLFWRILRLVTHVRVLLYPDDRQVGFGVSLLSYRRSGLREE
jgi:hypothetical protein